MNYDPNLPIDEQHIDDTDPKFDAAVTKLTDCITDGSDVEISLDYGNTDPIIIVPSKELKAMILSEPEVVKAISDCLYENPDVVVDYITDEEDEL